MESEKTESDFMMFVWFLVGNSDFSISYLKITQQWIVSYWTRINRRRVSSSCLEVFCRKVAFRNFAKFTGNRLCQSLFFNKVACLRPATLLKALVFYCEFCEISKNTSFYRTPLVAVSEEPNFETKNKYLQVTDELHVLPTHCF